MRPRHCGVCCFGRNCLTKVGAASPVPEMGCCAAGYLSSAQKAKNTFCWKQGNFKQNAVILGFAQGSGYSLFKTIFCYSSAKCSAMLPAKAWTCCVSPAPWQFTDSESPCFRRAWKSCSGNKCPDCGLCRVASVTCHSGQANSGGLTGLQVIKTRSALCFTSLPWGVWVQASLLHSSWVRVQCRQSLISPAGLLLMLLHSTLSCSSHLIFVHFLMNLG